MHTTFVGVVDKHTRMTSIESKYCGCNACISCTVNRERTFITFSELYTKSELFAKGLSTLGYVRDSIIAIETSNVRGISNHCNAFAYLVQNPYNLLSSWFTKCKI
jgi:hypothetical protein